MKRIIVCFLSCILMIGFFSGCDSSEDITIEQEQSEALLAAMEEINSCQTSILFEMQARIGSSNASNGHTASIGSDITISSSMEPFSYHGEYYSQILVDGVRTREDQEFYATIKEKYVSRILLPKYPALYAAYSLIIVAILTS